MLVGQPLIIRGFFCHARESRQGAIVVDGDAAPLPPELLRA